MSGQSGKEYFESYENFDSHDVMLKDERRMYFYKEFCQFCNSKFVKDKVVLDLGSGTGILSMFAASNGAKKVYAVEASEMASLSAQIFKDNKLDHIIEVVHSKVEDVTLPEKVDVIISEWMGFYLVHEGMLSSLIFARDNFLKPGGILFPNKATLFAAPVDMKQYVDSNFTMYDSLQGFSYSSLKHLMWKERLKTPLCEVISPQSILAFAAPLANWNLNKIDEDTLDSISQTIKFDINRAGTVHGVSFWFSVGFQAEEFDSILDTSPFLAPTHWKQTTAFLPHFSVAEEGDSLVVEVELDKSEENNRWYDISLTQRTLLEKSFSILPESEQMQYKLRTVDGEEVADEEGVEDIGEEGDAFAALVDALSEQFDADPQEIIQVISNTTTEDDDGQS